MTPRCENMTLYVESLDRCLPQPDRMVVECGALIEQVVGADDGGVAAGVAAADPALLEHRDVGGAVLAGDVVGRLPARDPRPPTMSAS